MYRKGEGRKREGREGSKGSQRLPLQLGTLYRAVEEGREGRRAGRGAGVCIYRTCYTLSTVNMSLLT